jgi:tRNA threonylcarbamoyladenosine biosynthesis protein TsaE
MRLYLEVEEAQETFGRLIAAHLRAPGVIFLEGDLGVGKTTLVRGILRGLGHRGSVRSPTYTLIEPYDVAGVRLYHLDLYRLGDPEELEYLGLRDFLDQGSVLLVEWPERGTGWLPPPDLRIHMVHAAPGRKLELFPGSEAGKRLVANVSRPPEGRV